MLYARPHIVRCATIVITLLIFPSDWGRAQDISLDSDDSVTTAVLDGQSLFEYRHTPHPTKCYVSRWYTPAGVQVLRDSPHDHVHHHALMYAIGIDEVDFWAEVPPENYGQQVSKELAASTMTEGGQAEASVKQQVDWVGPGPHVLAHEARNLRAQVGVIPGASLLTWQFTLRPASGKEAIKLWGRHYFGLGMRFVESMDNGSEIMLPQGVDGKSVRGTEKLTRAPWCAVHGSADGKPVTVAMFDAPDNPRHPATWFTMTAPFAYLGATLNLHEEPLIVPDGKPLKISYGLALWDGTIGAEQVEEAYQKWLKLKQ